MNIGHILCEKRKNQHLTLDKISSDIKIQKSYLEEIERGINKKPDMYMVGYVKLYASYLNVDISDYLDYLKSSTPHKKNALDPNTKIDNKDINNESLSFIIATFTVIISLAIILIGNHNAWKENTSYTTTSHSKNIHYTSSKAILKKINSKEYIIFNISDAISLLAEDYTEISLYDTNDTFIENHIMRFGEKKLLPISHKTIKIKVTTENSIKIDP